MPKTLKLTVVGLLALVLGSLVYVVVRAEGSSYLSRIVHYSLPVSFEFPFINNLPSFFHVLSFSLLTFTILGERKYALASCAVWLVINLLFEVGQHPYVTYWLDQGNVLLPIVLENYIRLGTFDVGDVAFSVLGATTAYSIIMSNRKKIVWKG